MNCGFNPRYNTLLYYLVQAIADTAKSKRIFTVADVWETLKHNRPAEYDRIREECGESRLMAVAIAKAKNDRRLIRRAVGSGTTDSIGHRAPRALWASVALEAVGQ